MFNIAIGQWRADLGRSSVQHVAFARKHLDDLLQELRSLPHLAGDAEGDLHPVAYACQRGDRVIRKGCR